MKIYLVLDFDERDRSRVHSAYLHRGKAEERASHLLRQQEASRIPAKHYHSYHVIKKTLKGNIAKGIKAGLIK